MRKLWIELYNNTNCPYLREYLEDIISKWLSAVLLLHLIVRLAQSNSLYQSSE